MGKAFLRTLRCPRKSYAEFILGDRGCHRDRQIGCLLCLRELSSHYKEESLTDVPSTEWDPGARKNSVDWAFEVFLMKRAILAGRPHQFKQVAPVLTRQANETFLLAMLHGHVQIVSYFLDSGLIHGNQSIFGPSSWPAYCLFACVCPPDVLSLFRSRWGGSPATWNGLSCALLSGMAGKDIGHSTYLEYMSYQQYHLINRYRGVELARGQGHPPSTPLFLLDFACMVSDRALVKQILAGMPEAGFLSQLSFIVQSEEHIILILSRYGFQTNQCYNGLTPLHISCCNNDFFTLSILLYIGFPIVRDSKGRFPNELGGCKIREKASIFFNICAGLPEQADGREVRQYSRNSFRQNMRTWMNVLKYDSRDLDKYMGIFRFNISGIFNISVSPVSVKRALRWLSQNELKLGTYTKEDALSKYLKYFG